MIENPAQVIRSFKSAAKTAGLPFDDMDVSHEVLLAPHRQPSRLPSGFTATYAFSLSESYGKTCEAGPNRVLKVGKVGLKSGSRFTSQHYLPSSTGSNLAKSILHERLLWPYLGIGQLDEKAVKAWMLENLERDHFFFPSSAAGVEREMERFLRGRLGPIFEG